MVKRTLVERDELAGEETLRALDAAGLPIDAALWLYDSAEERWLFIVATRLWDEGGPRGAYAAIQTALKQHGSVGVRFDEITAVSPNESTISGLHEAISTGPGISRIRFTGNVVNGKYVEDALIYRVA